MHAAASSGFSITRIGQIYVSVQDLARATRFYRDTLGMTFLFEVPGMAVLDCGGVRLMLATPEGNTDVGRATIIYYQVDDIHGAYETLQGRGVRFEREPHFLAKLASGDLWMTFLKDSEDNTVGLMSEIRS